MLVPLLMSPRSLKSWTLLLELPWSSSLMRNWVLSVYTGGGTLNVKYAYT